jgi:uncharacterized protein with ParB-like and HNH nuclease domain
MNVWKIGSRWNDSGNANASLIRIFRRSNVVFNGSTKTIDYFKKVQKGDYFAIADGYKIVAVAKAISDVMTLREMFEKNILKIRQTDTLNGASAEEELRASQDIALGVRVKLVDLADAHKLFEYKKMGAFFYAKSIKEHVMELYETEGASKFDITSSTYTFASNKDNKKSILDSKTTYTIPIYQREYAWEEEQVGRFIRDIYSGYVSNEPMFIGTMQLSARKYVASNEFEQDVIDGQQRLSTFFCLLKYLSLQYPREIASQHIHFDWLDTRVNNGKENERLQKLINITSMEGLGEDDIEKRNNRYIQNTTIIASTFDELLSTDDKDETKPLFSPEKFISYVFTSIYFVVIETTAGLSKTIQIFNTINTAGLDLNGDDLFKVRFFEYLKDIQGHDDNTFSEISKFYGEVKDINDKWLQKGHNDNLVTIEEIRAIYKDYIISKGKLSNDLYAMATDTFFERFFDHLLKVKDWSKDFGKQDFKEKTWGEVLSLDVLCQILKVAVLWNEHIHDFTSYEQVISWNLFDYTRYSRYRRIVYQVLLSMKKIEDGIQPAHQLLSVLFRAVFCESIKYSRHIYATNLEIQKLYKHLYSDGVDDTITEAKKLLQSRSKEIENYIGCEIFENGKCHRTWGNLICMLSAYLDEIRDHKIDINELTVKLFYTYFDLEHIHATANSKECIGITDDLQNSIGNLMLLEYDINRSIGNGTLNEKKEKQNNRRCYTDSNYACVKKIIGNTSWDIENIKKRKDEEVKRIKYFLTQLI